MPSPTGVQNRRFFFFPFPFEAYPHPVGRAHLTFNPLFRGKFGYRAGFSLRAGTRSIREPDSRACRRGVKKRHYITAASQCRFPDAKIGQAAPVVYLTYHHLLRREVVSEYPD
jgi:hypothetical protein